MCNKYRWQPGQRSHREFEVPIGGNPHNISYLYCSSVPFRVGIWGLRGDDYGGGDLVVGVEVEELDAGVERPAERTVLVSMRMILPNWLMSIISVVSSTRLMAVTLRSWGWSSWR